ncbi:MAG: acetate--CoA ligase family protein, partial [Candidatus Bipolaricaulota bacterium]
LRVLCDLGELQERSAEEAGPTYEIPEGVCDVIRTAISEGREGLTFAEGAAILGTYGIEVCPYAYAEGPDEAVSFAKEYGYPVVAKLDAPGLAHRFERGAVLTGLHSREALTSAVEGLSHIAVDDLAEARVLIQPQLEGRELILGMERDRSFGPVVMFGIGGTLVEALQDVSFAVAPLARADADRMIRSIRSFPLLEAFRGQAAADLDALAEALVGLGRLAAEIPEIEEIDLNPTMATDRFAVAVDILIRLRTAGGAGAGAW